MYVLSGNGQRPVTGNVSHATSLATVFAQLAQPSFLIESEKRFVSLGYPLKACELLISAALAVLEDLRARGEKAE